MDLQIWSKSEEKWAYVLLLRNEEVHRIKITGNMLTLKRNLNAALEALQQGKDPSELGAKSVETLKVGTISKAEVSPENNSLTLYGDGEKPQELAYTSAESNADEIMRAIFAKTGKNFQSAQEPISAIDALLPPIFLGVLGGLFWGAIYQSAGQIASGQELEVHGARRRGFQRIMISLAEILGTNGTILVGVVLLVLIVGWAAKRIIHRPERTVWLPVNAPQVQ
jgi:hypothetical protein